MHVVRQNDRWECICTFYEKDIAKAAGFRWDPAKKVWFTVKPDIAAKLATPEQLAELQRAMDEAAHKRAELIENSRAGDSAIDIPCPEGLAYLPYQRAGIAGALLRPNVLLGDDMGLGKTIQAAGIINADPTLRKILIVCPASLRLNWRRELKKWLVRPFNIAFGTGQSFHPQCADITIINYDILSRHHDALRRFSWDCIIADEAHLMKNPKAKRTIALLGRQGRKARVGYEEIIGIEPVRARRALFLTGTPIPNRVEEGFALFNYLDPERFKSKWKFTQDYDNSGRAGLEKLQQDLRGSIMIRRLKMDVLTELPAKRRAIIEIPSDGIAAVEREQEAWRGQEERLLDLRVRVELSKASDNPDDYAEAVADLKQAMQVAFTEMSRVRHETAVAKIPFVIEHLKDAIEQGEKCVCFAHHHDVIEGIYEAFGSQAVMMYGETSFTDRQAAVDRFQQDEGCRLFIGGILAAGVGITLTASAHVVFAELDWVPGNVTQAEDRCHRIGQTDAVLVQHLVLEGSLDAHMAEVLVEKQEIIAAALDDVVTGAPAVPVPKEGRGTTEGVGPAKLAKEAEALSQHQIEAVHAGLRMLADMDGDFARVLNGQGFSRIDVEIGHSLANAIRLSPKQAALGAKLVRKYHRQLPAEITEGVRV